MKEVIIAVLKELILPEIEILKKDNEDIKTRLELTNKRLDDVNLHLVDHSRRIDEINKTKGVYKKLCLFREKS